VLHFLLGTVLVVGFVALLIGSPAFRKAALVVVVLSRREGSTILGIAPVPVAKILARCRPPRTRETAVPASSFLRQRLISQGTQAIRRTPPRLPL
jgi:hypothetical protein